MAEALNIGKLSRDDQKIIALARVIAKQNHMSLSGWVLELIKKAVREAEAAPK